MHSSTVQPHDAIALAGKRCTNIHDLTLPRHDYGLAELLLLESSSSIKGAAH